MMIMMAIKILVLIRTTPSLRNKKTTRPEPPALKPPRFPSRSQHSKTWMCVAMNRRSSTTLMSISDTCANSSDWQGITLAGELRTQAQRVLQQIMADRSVICKSRVEEGVMACSLACHDAEKHSYALPQRKERKGGKTKSKGKYEECFSGLRVMSIIRLLD